MTALPSPPVGVSCLPERKITLRFARFGAVCMHCITPTNSGGPTTTTTVKDPQNTTTCNEKVRRKPVVSSFNSKPKPTGHRRCFSATSQGSLSSKGCAALAAFEALCLSDGLDDSVSPPPRRKFKSMFSTEMPPTPVLGPTTRKEPDIPAFNDLDCDTTTPSSECMSPPPLDL